MYKLLHCRRAFAMLAIVSVSGCGSVVTDQPLSEAGTAVVIESLVGIWQEIDFTVFAREPGEPSGVELAVTLQDDGSYEVVCRDENENEEGIFRGKCFELEGKTFFTPTRLIQRVNDKLIDVSQENAPGKLFINFALHGDELELRMPDPEAFAKLLERSAKLRGSVSGWPAKKVVVTSPPAEAAQEIINHFDILFGKPNRYRRKNDRKSGPSPENINSVPAEVN